MPDCHMHVLCEPCRVLSSQHPPSSAPFPPPPIAGGVCSQQLPMTSTYDRFVWIANYYASQGFYVTLVYHTDLKVGHA